MSGLAAVRGQAVVKYEDNHTIPQELFKGGRLEHPLIELFQGLDGWKDEFDLIGKDNPHHNLQPLPDSHLPGGSAAHHGSHPSVTELVEARLQDTYDEFLANPDMQADIDAARARDPAAMERVKKAIGDELREHASEIQFKSSNFMDVDGPNGPLARDRLVYNIRDLEYLKQTQTWAAATADERRIAETKPGNLIRRHNALVNNLPIDGDRALEMKVLRDFGETGLAHTDGTPQSRDAVRAIVAQAKANNVDLMTTKTTDFLIAREGVLDNAVQPLTQQIDNLTAQIAQSTSPTQKAQLLSQRVALEADRLAIYASQTYGDNVVSVSAQVVRKVAANLIGSRGTETLSEVALFLLKRLAPKLIPGLNIISTAYDIYELLNFIHTQMKERGGYEWLRNLFSNTPVKDIAHSQNADGQEAIAITLQEPDLPTVVVTAERRANSYWKVTGARPVSAGRWTIDLSESKGTSFYYDPDEGLGGMGSAGPIDLPPQGGWTRGTHIRLEQDGGITYREFEENSLLESLDQPFFSTNYSTLTSDTLYMDWQGVFIDREEKVEGLARENTVDGKAGTKVGFFTLGYATLASTLVSQLGRLVNTNSPWVRLGVNTVLSTVGQNLSQAIQMGGLNFKNLDFVLDDFETELGLSAVGAVSSYLFGELVGELGLPPEVEQFIASTGGAAISQIAQNLAAPPSPTGETVAWNANVGPAMVNAAASFLGTYLASELYQFDTIDGQVGAQIGATIGAAIGGAYGDAPGAFAGAFIGYYVGGFISTLFGSAPQSGADVNWVESFQEFRVGRAWKRHESSVDAARSLATGVVTVLNNVLRLTGSRLVDGTQVRVGSYGTFKQDFVYRETVGPQAGQHTLRTKDPQEVLTYGSAMALADMVPRLQGGDVFVKRALAATLTNSSVITFPNHPGFAGTFEIEALFGNLATARDYRAYRQNAANIDALVKAEPSSEFAATWIATLARAYELGLHRRAATDWAGGWTAFLDEALDGRIDGNAFLPTNLSFTINPATGERLFAFFDADGNHLGNLGDTIDTSSTDDIAGTSGADTIEMNGGTLTNTTGLTINGTLANGSPYEISVAASINAGEGNDLVIASRLGNEVSGGDGNDTLIGSDLDDWIMGDAGDDRIFAGYAWHVFTDGDAAGTAAALNTHGNGDFVDGGDGNDILYGTRGSDWLMGGGGADLILGGAGADILMGGEGDDRGPAGEARLLGGAGTDQYVFGYGDGVDVVFDESDNSGAPGGALNSLHVRLQGIDNGTIQRNWAGGGDYEADGDVRGGVDAIVFGPGVSLSDIIIRRSGTTATPGSDLIIQLTYEDEVTHARVLSGDELTIKDWFEPTRRVEWLRFATGEEIRIGDISSTIVGTSESDIIVGTAGGDFLVGGAGSDTIRGLQGNDFGFGDAGNDLVAGDEDNDLVAGGSDDDQVIGGLGNDTVFGDGGSDYVYGGGGYDILAGGRGDDEVVGGAGDDIFRYERGDGRDIILDEYVNNWDLVWQNGSYTNGYSLDVNSGVVSKNGTTVFDGTRWIGVYDYANETQTLRRHLGEVGGAISENAGTDVLEFGVGIDIQDLRLHRDGDDLQIAIGLDDNDSSEFDSVTDRITLRDWYTAGPTIESFVFAATGRLLTAPVSMAGEGNEYDDVIGGTSGVDWITGNGGDDTISGGAGNDILSGNSGADRLRGDGGNDVLYGGADDDVLEGGAAADLLFGGSGVDLASYANATTAGIRASLGAPQTTTLDGFGDSFSSIEGLEGTTGGDWLGGDAGQNVLRGIQGNDTLNGGAGDDIYEIELSHGQDVIVDADYVTEEIIDINGAFNSLLYTATWTDMGYGGTAQGDRFRYQLVITRNGTGEEIYRSRMGTDFIYTSAQSGMPPPVAWPSANNQWSNGATRTGNGVQTIRDMLQSVDGGRDTIDFGVGIGLTDLTFTRLNGGADLQITYQSGNFVTIAGQNDPNRAVEAIQLADGLSLDLTRLRVLGEAATAGEDFMVGSNATGPGDTLEGLGGDDVLSGLDGGDTLRGGDGNDIIEGGAGADAINGGSDSVTAGADPGTFSPTQAFGDTARYVRSTSFVTINLETNVVTGGHASGDTIERVAGVSTIENLVGSAFNDKLTGDSRANRLFGLGGNDTLEGRAGDDVLGGGAGEDTLRAGEGNDSLAGDAGDDILRGENGNDLLAGGTGFDNLNGGAGTDALTGGDGNDVLNGDGDNDALSGDAGVDELYGGDGDDQLSGGEDGDLLYGGDGSDVLAGGAGDDWLDGETGDDRFVFDMNSGSDNLSDTDGNNRVVIADATVDRIWLTRDGDNLRIAVIGGTTSITVVDYYIAGATVLQQISLETQSLFLLAAEPLIQAMTQHSATPPATMPTAIASTLASYWVVGDTSSPVVTDQDVSTNEDTPITGTVGASDADDNIESYAIHTAPTRGTVNIDATTGSWTYTPTANLHGTDTFQIVVTDAHDQTAVQTVTVNVISINDAPSDIAIAGAPAGIAERDHPVVGTLMDPIVLGTLNATDVDAPDPGDFATHVFSVNDSRFEIINGTTLQLKAGVALDFEAEQSVTLELTVRDRAGAPTGLSFTKNFTFNVIDLDDYFYGTVGADTLTGQSGRNIMFGFGGDDVLTGGNAVDTIDGGDGADQLFGLGGNDTLDGNLGQDSLDGGEGNDTLHGGDGTDALLGQAGADQLFGDGGADQLQGNEDNDLLDGGGDNDRLEGGAGDDQLAGGEGNDVLIGGVGADHLLGGNGFDTVSYETANAAVTVNLATSSGSAGDAAGDVFDDAPEVLVGSIHGDTLTGSAAGDIIEGGDGNDTIYGGTGNDILRGGNGNDIIDAQAGNDTLDGGAGNDVLIGGDDSDTYLMRIDAGNDEIYNFDPNGTDIDVVGYENITNNRLWFERTGNDLVVTVIDTNVRTTVKDWYLIATANERANYKIDFFLAGNYVTHTIDAEGLVDLMDGYTKPVNQAAYDALHATSAFEEPWRSAWKFNGPPAIPDVAASTINEDGTLSLVIRVTDDFTPHAGVTVTAQAVRADNHDVEDLSLVNAPTISTSTSEGDRTLTVTTKPNASGQVAIKVSAIDAGGMTSQKVFLLNITPVPDVPVVTQAVSLPPSSPATRPTLALGSLGLDIQSALVDNDGSETLTIRITGVPTQLTFTAGTNLGGGVWSFTPAQLAGLRIQGPPTFSQNVHMSVTATSSENSTGATSNASPARSLDINFNAAPTDIQPGSLSVDENLGAGTLLGTLTRTDPDSVEDGGDTPTFSLLSNPGNLFSISAAGTLTTNASFNREAASSYDITVRVTDAGGLSYNEVITVTINDVNEAPVINGTYSYSVPENASSGHVLGTVSVTDPDTFTPAFRDMRYELVGGTGPFQINATTGQLSLQGGLNYESVTGYNFSVRVWDGGAIGVGNVVNAPVSVAVANVNEPTTINNTTFSVPETGGGPGVHVGTVTGSDPDGPLAFQLLNGAGAFTINSSGQLFAQTSFNYEAQPSYDVGIRAWDGGTVGVGNAFDTTIRINITDQPEAPTLSFNPRTDGVMSSYVGRYTPSDSDVGSSFTYEIVYAYQHVVQVWYQQGQAMTAVETFNQPLGNITINSLNDLYCDTTTGVFDNTGGSGWGTIDHYQAHWNIAYRVRDNTGLVSNTVEVEFWGTSGRVLPIVIDLDGDGLELVSLDDSRVAYSMSDAAPTMRTGWVGADDALLALDRNGDGTISGRTEISFVDDVPHATSDLEGLAAYDSNEDGYLNAGDARFGEFRVWQDANQDGVSQAAELRSLADSGIEAIGLTRTLTGQTAAEGSLENVVSATAEMVRSDGSGGVVGDVAFAYLEQHVKVVENGAGSGETSPDDVNRGAHDELAAARRLANDALASNETPDRLADRTSDRAAAPELAQSTAPELATPPGDQSPNDPASDLPRSSGDASAEVWEYSATPTQGALHAGLDSIARRRLQMIDAMASFSAEGASSLELRPQRRVDARTLELLTAVSGIRSAA
jgi:Ca2+-binding RTX toxin-like protein